MSYKRIRPNLFRIRPLRSDRAAGELPLEDVLEQTALRETTRRSFLSAPKTKPTPKPQSCLENLIRLLAIWRLFAKPNGCAYLFCLTKDCQVSMVAPLMLREVRLKESYAAHIQKQIRQARSAYFFVAHSHQSEPLFPSPDDVQLTRTFHALTAKESAGSCVFLGHYIVRDFEAIRIHDAFSEKGGDGGESGREAPTTGGPSPSPFPVPRQKTAGEAPSRRRIKLG